MELPRLILVGGMSGSGKSTLSQAISRELCAQGIANRWMHEEMVDHPIRSREFSHGSLYDPTDFAENIDRLLDKWRRLAEEIQWADRVYVMEGCLYQNIIRYFYEVDYAETQIVAFYDRLFSVLGPADPLLILLSSSDARNTLESVYAERGNWWKELILDPGECRYLANRDLTGAEGIYVMWQSYQVLATRIHRSFGGRSLLFDVATERRETFLERVMSSIGLSVPEEAGVPQADEADPLVTGRYRDPNDPSAEIQVLQDENGLFCRSFWQRMPLVPIGGRRYYIASFPIELRFSTTGGGQTVTISGEYDWHLGGRTLVRAEA